MMILVTGGVRSGKSTHAEKLMADAQSVTYVASGPIPDGTDEEWSARIAAHQERRPVNWSTVESGDLASAVEGKQVVLIDDLGTWVTAMVDDMAGWKRPFERWRAEFDRRVAEAVTAVSATQTAVIVTNEVGMGVVPDHASGRLFRDLLGTVNQRFAVACDEVHLVVSGRVLKL
ncbi:MAG: bifunctional adenosylcobinamide kinase/adenosylcobinamide-phosphate guanylyltransferase [Nocardioides sp.]|nr:bifunctional adenosylcobinamide kinase/adenosylcobinamide-phosphate guanylyltransferase [Nocardioides sp.]